MTFGEHGSSAQGKRAVSTTRVREFRKFKLRAAWRSGLPQSDYRSVIPDVG